MVKAVGAEIAPGRLQGALLHPRPRPVGRGTAPPSHRPLRLSARGACAVRLSAAVPARAPRAPRAAEGARERHAHRHRASSTSRRWASTRPRTSTARNASGFEGRGMNEGRFDGNALDRLPGRARGQFAHRLRRQLSRPDAASLRDLRGRVRRAPGGRRRPRHDPDREFDRRAAWPTFTRSCPPPGLHIVGETFLPIHFQLLAVAGRADRGPAGPSTATSTRSASAATSSAATS